MYICTCVHLRVQSVAEVKLADEIACEKKKEAGKVQNMYARLRLMKPGKQGAVLPCGCNTSTDKCTCASKKGGLRAATRRTRAASLRVNPKARVFAPGSPF